jgi:hypothetical protein
MLEFKTTAGLEKYINDKGLTKLYDYVSERTDQIPLSLESIAKNVYNIDDISDDDIIMINDGVKILNNISLFNGYKYIKIFDYKLIIMEDVLSSEAKSE